MNNTEINIKAIAEQLRYHIKNDNDALRYIAENFRDLDIPNDKTLEEIGDLSEENNIVKEVNLKLKTKIEELTKYADSLEEQNYENGKRISELEAKVKELEEASL